MKKFLSLPPVSFVVETAELYLRVGAARAAAALSYFQEYSRLRNQALRDFSSMYGPLTVDTARANQQSWEWVSEPWPWEGGAC